MSERILKKVPGRGPCGERCRQECSRVMTPPNINLRQGQSNVTRTDDAKITDHWDGRRDVTVTPNPLELSTAMQENPEKFIGSAKNVESDE